MSPSSSARRSQCFRQHAQQRLDVIKWVGGGGGGWSDDVIDSRVHVDVTVQSPMATDAEWNTFVVSVCDRAE